MDEPSCRKCHTEEKELLCKNGDGYLNLCKPCRNAMPKPKKKAVQKVVGGMNSGLIKHRVPCRNGCRATITVTCAEGVTPSKFQYCASCKSGSAGLGQQGTYPEW